MATGQSTIRVSGRPRTRAQRTSSRIMKRLLRSPCSRHSCVMRDPPVALLVDGREQGRARQLTRLVPWKLCNELQRSWQECRIDVPRQRREDLLAGSQRRNDKRSATPVVARHEDDRVSHALDRKELLREISERGALAGDLDEIPCTAQQSERAICRRVDQILQRNRLRQMLAEIERATVDRLEPGARQAVPAVALDCASSCHGACLRAAIDLDDRRVHKRFGGCGLVRGKARGGLEGECQWRQTNASRDASAQVGRRRDEYAWRRNGLEGRRDVPGKERALIAHGTSGTQCQ